MQANHRKRRHAHDRDDPEPDFPPRGFHEFTSGETAGITTWVMPDRLSMARSCVGRDSTLLGIVVFVRRGRIEPRLLKIRFEFEVRPSLDHVQTRAAMLVLSGSGRLRRSPQVRDK
jgi:hypothetical protein